MVIPVMALLFSNSARYASILMDRRIGVDLVSISRFADLFVKYPRLSDRLFTKLESSLSINQLAGNFAAKEALLKATRFDIRFAFNKVAVLRESGAPYFHFEPPLNKFLNRTNTDISISNECDVALAVVLIDISDIDLLSELKKLRLFSV
jgi:holo-[acyl-carrier protein] synthase